MNTKSIETKLCWAGIVSAYVFWTIRLLVLAVGGV